MRSNGLKVIVLLPGKITRLADAFQDVALSSADDAQEIARLLGAVLA